MLHCLSLLRLLQVHAGLEDPPNLAPRWAHLPLRHRVLALRSAAAHAPARAIRALTCALEAASAVLLRQVPLPVESTLPSPSARRCAWIQLLIVLFCAGDHLSMLPPAFQLRRISTHLAIAGQPAHALDFFAGKAILWN